MIPTDMRGSGCAEIMLFVDYYDVGNFHPPLLLSLHSIQADTADATSTKHLDLLIDCVKRIYIPPTQRFLPLLECGEMTFDLLWARFKLYTRRDAYM